MIPHLRVEFPWLNNAPATSLQRVARNLDRDVNAAINIRNIGLEKIGMCHAEFTPVEIPLMEISDSSGVSHVSPKQEVQLAHNLC